MARYLVKFYVNSTQINTLRKQVASAFPGMEAHVDKANPARSRADRLSEIAGTVADAASEVETLKEEMEEWHDSIPDNLKDGDKASEVQEAIDALDTINSDLTNIDFDQVSFPGIH